MMLCLKRRYNGKRAKVDKKGFIWCFCGVESRHLTSMDALRSSEKGSLVLGESSSTSSTDIKQSYRTMKLTDARRQGVLAT